MTLRIAGVEAHDVIVAGQQALKIMVGTGSSAVQAWYRVLSGSFESTLTSSTSATYAECTVLEAGTYRIRYTLTTLTGSSAQIRASIAGANGFSSSTTSVMGSPAVIDETVTIPAGGTVLFRGSVAILFTATARGVWSVAKQ